MTVLEDVADLVRRVAPRFICDDCIAQKLGLTVRQHANQKTRELAAGQGFQRRKDVCYRCGGEKLVIGRA